MDIYPIYTRTCQSFSRTLQSVFDQCFCASNLQSAGVKVKGVCLKMNVGKTEVVLYLIYCNG